MMRRFTKIKKRQKASTGLEFVTQGIACQCLTMLEQVGLLDALSEKGAISVAEADNFGNPQVIRSALTTLAYAGLLSLAGTSYLLTPFGNEILHYLGLVTVFFDGYGGLLANQAKIAQGQKIDRSRSLDGNAIARASSSISGQFIEPAVVPTLQSLGIKGTICDLGCGHADLLGTVCRDIGIAGLGIEICSEVVEEARRNYAGSGVEIELGDVTNLRGSWEDVAVLMQCHVFHDFVGRSDYSELLASFRLTFPNHRYFFYIDTVAAEPDGRSAFPGFDYIHGLLGIQPPTYGELKKTFLSSGYDVERELPIKGLPNTGLWILRRKA